MTRISVRSGSPYDVVLGRGFSSLRSELLDASPNANRYLIIHQPALLDTAKQVAAAVEGSGKHAFLFELADAEAGKTVASAEACWDECARVGLTRRDCIISIGGGAATDLAGFIAATWMRGIGVVHIPTTLLAMVDASVGGKTGINTAAGKNLVGAFHEPLAVLIDLDTLKTLPREELIAGSAEIIKAGFIRDTRILELFEEDSEAALDPEGDVLPEVIERAIAVKADVVAKDLKESHLREILNYGHTFGHAVEQQEEFRWRHGQAVAVGMMFEAELAQLAGLIGQDVVDQHRRILKSVGLATDYDHDDVNVLIDVMRRDKKNRDGIIRFVVLEGLGEPTRLEGPEEALLVEAWGKVKREGAK